MTNIAIKQTRTLRRWMPVVVGLLLLPLSACSIDELLKVDDPDVATPGSVGSPSALGAVLNAARADFQVAFDGTTGDEGQVNLSGLFSDEFLNAESFPTRIEIDQRNVRVDNATAQGIFFELSRGRRAAEFAAEQFEQFDPGSDGHAEALALAGFTYIFFAEHYCSGVPFSRISNSGAVEFGSPQTTIEMFNTAIARFDQAIAMNPSSAVLNLALVGKARAQLGLGQFAQAGTTASAVPTSFVWMVEHSTNTTREQNGVHNFTYIAERWSVADNEGTNGLPYRSDLDPRIHWERRGGTNIHNGTNVGFEPQTPQYDPKWYDDRGADVILASGLEARLIEAEAALRAGTFATTLSILNALRTPPFPAYFRVTTDPLYNTLGALADPGTQTAREDMLFKERAYWLWLTAHRLGDMRRLVRHYGRTQDQVFPVGVYSRPQIGGQYGTDVNMPVPVDEENNPNFDACLDRNA